MVAVARLAQAEAAAPVAGLDPNFIASGRISLIGLDAVRERLGERWSARREQIWGVVERFSERGLGPGDLFQRVSETDWLIGYPDASPAAARGRALRLLTEILNHFLGAAQPRDFRISTVLGLDGDRIEARPLTPQELAAADGEPLGSAPVPHPPPLAPAPASDAWVRTPITLGSGRPLTLVTWREPVWHARSGRCIALRTARRLLSASGRALSPAERERLEPREHLQVDLATLELVDWAAGGVVLLPVSFAAFAHSASRLSLTSALAHKRAETSAALLFEIEDLAEGTPASRITEAFGCMRPFARALMVRCEPTRQFVESLRGAGARGVCVDPAKLDGSPGDLFGRVRLLRQRAEGVAGEVLALELPSPELAAVAVAAGAGFYSIRPDPYG